MATVSQSASPSSSAAPLPLGERDQHPSSRRSPLRARLKDAVDPTGLLLLLPAGLLLILFVAPVGYAFYLGFTNLELVGPTAQHYAFTGMANLKTMYHDSVFWTSLWETGIFLGGSAVVGVTVVGLGLALLLQRAVGWVRVVVGGIVIVAWIMPAVTAAILWFAFSTQGGVVSGVLGGSSAPLDNHALLVVSIANVWSTAGFSMLVLSGGLQSVPTEVVEAAQMESASRWRILRSITLPIMRPTIITNMLLVTILSLSNFTLIYIMTQGGPGNSTDILPIYSYQQAFLFSRLAYGALLGDVVVVLGSVLAYLYVRANRRHLRPAGGLGQVG